MRIKPVQFVARAKDFFLDLVFPMECVGCGICGTYLCAPCFSRIPVFEAPACPACNAPSFESATCGSCKKITKLNGVIAATLYTVPVVRRLVTLLKYRFVKPLAVPMGQLVLKHLAERNYALFARRDTVLVPLPLRPHRLRQRGFNQAAEIAAQLAPMLRMAIDEYALVRIRNTMPQTETDSRAERLQNVKDAFAVTDAARVKHKAVIIVDDVATTCATLSECAKVLKTAGAREVWGLVVAREPYGGVYK